MDQTNFGNEIDQRPHYQAESEEVHTGEPAEESGEDMLLVQIDAFRDKARQLQSFISAKERKVKELEALVRAKEAKNIELQQILAKKQAEADGIVKDVETQVDRMMQNMKASMDDLEGRIATQVSNNEMAAAEQTREVRDTLQNMSTGLADVTTGLEGISSKLDEVVDSGIKNVGEQITGVNTQIHGVKTQVDDVFSQMEGVTGKMDEVNDRVGGVGEKVELVTANVGTMSTSLEEMGNELSEKVHSENVKCYRNIQDLMKEMDDKDDTGITSEKHFTSLKGQLGFLTCFSIVNFLLTIVVVLCLLGVF